MKNNFQTMEIQRVPLILYIFMANYIITGNGSIRRPTFLQE